MSSLFDMNCECVQGIEHFIDPRLYIPKSEYTSPETLSLPVWEQNMIEAEMKRQEKEAKEEEEKDISISSEQLVSLVVQGTTIINKDYTNIVAFQINSYYTQIESIDKKWLNADTLSLVFTHSKLDESYVVPVLAIGTPVLIPNEVLIPGTLSISAAILNNDGTISTIVTNSIDYHVYAPKIKPVDFDKLKDLNLYYYFLNTVTNLTKDFKDISSKIIDAPQAEEFRDAIQELNRKIDEIVPSISVLAERMRAVEYTAEVHSEKINDLNSSIGTINSTINSILTSIGDILTKLASIDTDIDELKREMGSLVDSFRSIKVQIFSIEGNLEEINKKLALIDTNIRGLVARIATNEGNIAVLTEEKELLKERVDKLEEILPPFGYYTKLRKKNEFLYDIEYEDIDYNYAYEHLKGSLDMLKPQHACSAVYSNGYYGRNLDWLYNNNVSFIVHTPNRNGRYAVVGITDTMDSLTKDIVESRERTDDYILVPFRLVDGINEYGFACNYNVVPAGDKGITYHTNPSAPIKICEAMLIRYLLDHCKDTTEAIDTLINKLNIFAPYVDASSQYQELHFMIADKNKCYIIEFVEGNIVVIPTNDGHSTGIDLAQPIMTNFYIDGSDFDGITKHINLMTLTPYGTGTERYNILADALKQKIVESPEEMFLLMTSIHFTRAYQPHSANPFYSEFCGDYTHTKHPEWGNLTIYELAEHPEKFIGPIEYYANLFRNRQREIPTTWQSVHTCVFDTKDVKLYVWSQEEKDFTKGIIVSPTD